MSAVVIGTGVNELVCAHYLARSGRRVLVLDPGPGDQDSSCEEGWVPAHIVRQLDLERRGLKIDCPDPWIEAPLPGGGRLQLWQDMARSVDAIRRVSPADAAQWPVFCERMHRLARLLEGLYIEAPPDLMGRDPADLWGVAQLALRVRRLGRQGIEDFARALPMSVADLLDDWFESDALKGALAAAGIMQLRQGPRSGGTTYAFLHHHAGSPAGVFRPPSSNIRRTLCELPGIEIRRAAVVARISVNAGRAAGIMLADGEEIPASVVVSGASPRRTLLELVSAGWLDPQLSRALRNIRSRGVVARVRLTFERAPGFAAIVIAPSLDYLERAYDDAKYGRISQAPYLEARSMEQAADGRHSLDVRVQYAPYALADGEWGDERRRALEEVTVKTLARSCPDLGVARVADVLSPRDLESAHGFPEGQSCHAELALDQALWMRPVPRLARYRTPIDGLYLCGPGMHPGAGVAGAAGCNAAREILRDLRQGK